MEQLSPELSLPGDWKSPLKMNLISCGYNSWLVVGLMSVVPGILKEV